jgi:CBS domain-containing protein
MIKDIISENSTINDSMKRVQQTARRCLVVANKDNILLGTLSDGDIRRALLKGLSTNSSIKTIYNKKSFFIFEKDLVNFNFKKIKKYEIFNTCC